MARCTDSLSRSWSKTISVLFQPFRFVFWFKMAIVIFIMNQFSNYQLMGQGYNYFVAPYLPEDPSQFGRMDEMVDKSMQFLPMIIGIAVAATLIMIVLTFLKSIMNFVFYDGVWQGVVYVRKSSGEYFGQIISYFLWNVLFSIFLFVLALIIVIAMGSLAVGLDMTQGNTTGLIIGITLIVGIFIIGGIFLTLYYVMLEAMVVPHMLVKKIGILEAWSRSLGLAFSNMWEFLGFVLIRVVINLIIGLIMAMVTFFIILIVGVVVGVLLGVAGNPVSDAASGFDFFKSPVTYFFMIPFSFLVTFILLPIPVFYNMYALCFNSSLTSDGEFEPSHPNTKVPIQESDATTQNQLSENKPETESQNIQENKPSGPLNFSEIPVDSNTWETKSTSGSEGEQKEKEDESSDSSRDRPY